MMADATHTQGPWKVKFQASKWDTRDYTDKYWHDQWLIKGPNNKHSPVAVVRVEGFGSGPSKAVRKANATLIAAAPDLLAALEVLVWQLDRTDGLVEELESMVAEAKAAIAKAKGA
jgi:hypothetical protein